MVVRMSELYTHFVTHYGDPRTQHWIGVKTPWLTLFTMMVYLFAVTKLLPWYMEDKKPFNLRKTLVVYNFTLSIFSLVMFLKLGFSGWFGKINLRCFPTDFSETPQSAVMLNMIWMFWISKFVELMDTVFFVLRKKDSQVTILHVYHHCTMIFNVWITIKICAVGHFNFVGLTNSFVHFPMYAYYGLAAIGPHMQKYLGWKKYITKIQLVQFVLNITHATQVFFNNCNVSMALVYISSIQSFIFFLLFLNFYKKRYARALSIGKGADFTIKNNCSYARAHEHPTSGGYALRKRNH